MRHFSFPASALFLLITSATGMSAFADSPVTTEDKNAKPPASLSPDAKIDELLLALKRERQADDAEKIANELIAKWEDFGSATINTLMKRGSEASDRKNYPAALDYFDQMITLEPDYAHAYFRRSYVNLVDGNTKKAVSDLYRTLELNPRHFGALFELARILHFSGHDKSAVATLERFLDLYPTLPEARELYSEITEKLAGTRS